MTADPAGAAVSEPSAASAAFFALSDWLAGQARPGETVTTWLRGEDTDFVRLGQGRVRQAGQVRERELTLTVVARSRQASACTDLSGDPAEDRARTGALLEDLRGILPSLPEDPFLSLCADPAASTDARAATLPASEEALGALLDRARGLDLVGIWASGPIYAGFASSLGHRHWFARASFHLDWSLHAPGGRAVKASYAGEAWDPRVLAERLAAQRRDLDLLSRPPRPLTPGRYRAYLAPAALQALLQLLGWGGFGLKAWRTRQTPLLRMVQGGETLDPRVGLREDGGLGLVPGFTAEGFRKPEQVTLVAAGRLGDPLAGARSAREYRVAVNAAQEAPQSLAMASGDLPVGQAPEVLGTGLYLSNLWYCNFSDRNAARVTGMTRYACLWVENGEAVAPFAPMRFDDSLLELLGRRLVALTRERELLLDDSTYEGRSTAGMLLPGALVEGFTLTL